MQVSEDFIEKFKKICEEKGGKEISHQEAYEGAQNLVNFTELIYDIAKKDLARKKRLKKEPEGFPVDGHYNCLVCYRPIDELTGWYDWYGHTCFICRRAIKDGIVPAFVCTDRDSFFDMSSLSYKFQIKHQTAKKYIREGKLHPRIVLNEDGKPHEYIFLKKENPSLIEKHSPEYKSRMRHRDKVDALRAKKEKKEWIANWKKDMREWRKKIKSK